MVNGIVHYKGMGYLQYKLKPWTSEERHLMNRISIIKQDSLLAPDFLHVLQKTQLLAIVIADKLRVVFHRSESGQALELPLLGLATVLVLVFVVIVA